MLIGILHTQSSHTTIILYSLEVMRKGENGILVATQCYAWRVNSKQGTEEIQSANIGEEQNTQDREAKKASSCLLRS